jgi:hypothetical protein
VAEEIECFEPTMKWSFVSSGLLETPLAVRGEYSSQSVVSASRVKLDAGDADVLLDRVMGQYHYTTDEV